MQLGRALIKAAAEAEADGEPSEAEVQKKREEEMAKQLAEIAKAVTEATTADDVLYPLMKLKTYVVGGALQEAEAAQLRPFVSMIGNVLASKAKQIGGDAPRRISRWFYGAVKQKPNSPLAKELQQVSDMVAGKDVTPAPASKDKPKDKPAELTPEEQAMKDRLGGRTARTGTAGTEGQADNPIAAFLDQAAKHPLGRALIEKLAPGALAQTEQQPEFKAPAAVEPQAFTPAYKQTNEDYVKGIGAGQQAPAAAPDAHAGLSGTSDYVNARDQWGNQYHQADDGRVFRRSVDPQTNQIKWTHMPNLSGKQMSAKESTARQQAWQDYYTNSAMNNPRYKQLWQNDPSAADAWLQKQIPRFQAQAAEKVKQEQQSQGAQQAGLTKFDPAALRQAAGGEFRFDKDGRVWGIDANGQAKPVSTAAIWAAQHPEEAARREAAKARTEARRANPEYQANVARAYQEGRAAPPSWVQTGNPEVQAQMVNKARVEAAPTGTPYNRNQAMEESRAAVAAAQRPAAPPAPPAQPAAAANKPSSPLPQYRKNIQQKQLQEQRTRLAGQPKPAGTAKIGSAILEVIDPQVKQAAPAHFRSTGRLGHFLRFRPNGWSDNRARFNERGFRPNLGHLLGGIR